MDWPAILSALAAGGLIGFVLGLVGGGGSILAVPLLLYLVGVESTHVAIGTAAVAVAVNAGFGLATHARHRNVKWGCAGVFAGAAVLGAAIGAELGKAMDADRLLALFAVLMVGVGLLTIRKRRAGSDPDVRLDRDSAGRLLPRLIPTGFGVGGFSGFFGIGGGFLIVPGLVQSTAMPISMAIGSSLLVIVAVGATTAFSYSVSGFVDWGLAGLMLLGGFAGATAGQFALKLMAGRSRLLEIGFGALVVAIGSAILVGELFG